jgi:hypothetical protein
MQLRWGIVAAFVAGLAVAGGAVLLLRDNTAREQEAARIAELDAQIQRLERTASRLSDLATGGAPVTAVPTTRSQTAASPPTPAAAREVTKHDVSQAEAIAAADAMVDQGLQSGHWSREQANELSVAVADLDVKEQGRILARISAASNAGQLQVELPR